jgi:hypothetical protein
MDDLERDIANLNPYGQFRWYVWWDYIKTSFLYPLRSKSGKQPSVLLLASDAAILRVARGGTADGDDPQIVGG